MNILFICTEAAPFAKSGGLGDVMGALPRELMKKGVNAKVMMPLYRNIKAQYFADMKQVAVFETHVSWRVKYCGLYSMEYDGVTFFFIDNEEYFARDAYYGYYDDGERFAYFCNAALDCVTLLPDFEPHILHCNEWQTALIPVYLKTLYAQSTAHVGLRTVFTIHNIEYQGKFGLETAEDLFALSAVAQRICEYHGCLNLMKGAIVTCDRLTTVSPTYAEEIKYDYFGRGLAHIIKGNEYKLVGILNGIDTKLFHPWNDKALYKRYSRKTKSGKAANKAGLQCDCGLEEREQTPMIGMVTRLVSHKGIDLIINVFDELMREDVQFVLLGSGDKPYEDFFRTMAGRYPGRVWADFAFSPEMASRIYAGADLFLMPSLSEPCGLSQMIAAKYGTVPIVRTTGGLKDSVIPYNPLEKTGNGVTFGQINAQDMLGAVKRAISLYHRPADWDALTDNAFASDFSWSRGAEQYMEVYGGIADGVGDETDLLKRRTESKDQK